MVHVCLVRGVPDEPAKPLEPNCTNIGNRSADWILLDLVIDNNGDTRASNAFKTKYDMGTDVHLGYAILDTYIATPLSQTSVVFNNTYQSYFDFIYNAAIVGDWTFDVYACAEYLNNIDCALPPITFSLEVKDPCLEPV